MTATHLRRAGPLLAALLLSVVALGQDSGAMVVWGDYVARPPSAMTRLVAAAVGSDHSLAVRADGSVVAWGNSHYGQCDVPPFNSGFVGISGGGCLYGYPFGMHLAGLRTDGSIIIRGSDLDNVHSVPSPNSGFLAVSAGGHHTLGLRSDGSVVGWGCCACGQCDVPVPNSGFIAVAAGECHSLGLKANGSVAAWGDNSEGQC